MRRIAVIGTGYVGLVSGAGLSDFGNRVVCADVNREKIDLLNRGSLPIYEPGLQELVARNVRAERLSFSVDVHGAIRDAEVVFIAVWTPPDGNGKPDLAAVQDVARIIGESLDGYKVICTKSTVPIGTGRLISEIIRSKAPSSEFDVASNPEFLREGSAVHDFLLPNRVVIGTDSDRALEVLKSVYRPLFINETPMVLTDVVTAETIKYASNGFLAVKISYINEIANLCDATGADVHVVAKAMGLDGRIGPKFLHPGPGFGGSCFPKDSRALAAMGEEKGVAMRVVRAAVETNEAQKKVVLGKLRRLLGGSLRGKRVAVLGLAFKANTDDVRESPAAFFLQQLLEDGATVAAYDPVANEAMRKIYPQVKYASSALAAADGADGAVLLTEWHEFRALDLEAIGSRMKARRLLDARNILNPEELKRCGFVFDNVGRSGAR